MRKKIFTVILIAIIAAACITFSGCANGVYGKIGKLLKNNYDSVRLTVVTEVEGSQLNSVYFAKTENDVVTVEYSYQLFNAISTENGSYTVPEKRISTYSGSMTVNINGKEAEIEVKGEKSNLSLREISAKNLNFDKNILDNVSDEENLFKADVTNAESFAGIKADVASAAVTVIYSEQAVNSIVFTYSLQNGATVTATYEFAISEK